MRDIYSSVKRTIIWVGEHSEDGRKDRAPGNLLGSAMFMELRVGVGGKHSRAGG